jgi:phosphatidylethanolamine/phosphatidyl-N-methylethanolamine N-methyltransferase
VKLLKPISDSQGSGRDSGLFLGQMLRRPGQVGAVSPSSRALGRMMTRSLGPGTGAVVELGGGTGRITEAILARGVAPEKLAIYEMDPAFAAILRRRFPGVTVIEADARGVAATPLTDVGAVVSSLPMLSIPASAQRQIVEGAFELLRPGGVLIQFTYGWRPSVDRRIRKALDLDWSVSPWVLANVPPARVYTFRRPN